VQILTPEQVARRLYDDKNSGFTEPEDEVGGFATYNKVQMPVSIGVTLAVQGTDFEFETVLDKLGRFSREAKKLIVVTPSAIYDSLTLVNFSYSRKAEQGANLLTVALEFVEVRETQVQVTTSVITKPKNPTSASTTQEGKKPISVVGRTAGTDIIPGQSGRR
jgi:hypothetical protein